ncbi:MAG: hypothetical protein IKN74_01050 [Clostridia bacterium]|nr:hypothetical protein [Bacilli bacterium]MBR3511530.1 hypothetical protein [Clostridia bacterium]
MFGLFSKGYKKIKVDSGELKVLIKGLNELRNCLIKEGKGLDYINELIMKYIDILER